MQTTIETEADISPEGHIRLPEKLRPLYGRHARLIMLFDEAAPSAETSALDKLRSLRGAYRDDPEFDAAMQDIDQAWQAWTP